MSIRTRTRPAARRWLRTAARPSAVLFSAAALVAAPLLPVPQTAGTAAAAAPTAERFLGARGGGHWQGGWAASVQPPVRGLIPSWAHEGFHEQTLRQVVRVSVGGTAARLDRKSVV